MATTVIDFANVSKRFVIKRDRRNSMHERFVRATSRQVVDDDIFWALRDVSFAVQRGETVGLIGHNGSGKSTTLKLITRILEPTMGSVSSHGRISAMLELGSGFHPDLTGRENIYLNGSILGYSRAEMRAKMERIIDFSELADFVDMPVKHYSSGMFMRLGFAIAINVDPDILITDEVLAVGDENFQRKCMERIYDFKRQGRTIMFVSHAMPAVQNLCDRVIWFDHGQVVADGGSLSVTEAYLQVANQVQRERLEHERMERIERQVAAGEAPATSDADPVEEVDLQRWGTREVEIVNVELVDGAGKPRAIFQTGDALTMRISYLAHERIERPVFGIALHHVSGFHINGPNSRFANLDIDVVDGPGVVEYTVEALPLMEGEYVFTTAIYDDSMTRPFDHHERKYPLRVVSSSMSERFGTIHIPSSWRWRPGEQPAAAPRQPASGTSVGQRVGPGSSPAPRAAAQPRRKR